MWKSHKGQCIDCPPGTTSLIEVKAGRCKKHNHEFKQQKKADKKGMTLEQMKREGMIAAAAKANLKKKEAKPKAKKPTGEKVVFEQIWETRPHVCEVCDEPIVRPDGGVGMFSHILSKGAATHIRKDERFIRLMGDGRFGNCNCHEEWEHRTAEMREDPKWQPFFKLLELAKNVSHETRKNKPLYAEAEVDFDIQPDLDCEI